jgi:hypothetical protein
VARAAIFFTLRYYRVPTVGGSGSFAVPASGPLANAERRYSRGLWHPHPALGALMTVCLLSLGGLPPTAGFIAKWYIFSAAVSACYYGLAILGVLTSVVSVFFYLRVVVMMYMSERDGAAVPAPVSPVGMAALAVSIAAIVYLGILPTRVLDLAAESIATIFERSSEARPKTTATWPTQNRKDHFSRSARVVAISDLRSPRSSSRSSRMSPRSSPPRLVISCRRPPTASPSRFSNRSVAAVRIAFSRASTTVAIHSIVSPPGPRSTTGRRWHRRPRGVKHLCTWCTLPPDTWVMISFSVEWTDEPGPCIGDAGGRPAAGCGTSG